MKLSTRVTYGLRAILDIATHEHNGPVKMKAIAERQGVSAKYLEHLLAVLKTRGMVRVARGARGGYELSRPPAEISLGEIFRALEGPLQLVECVVNSEACSRSPGCVTRDVWREMQSVIETVVDGMTLADLLARQESKKLEVAQKPQLSYHI